MKSARSTKVPEPFGPYSQAIIANGFIFCAGQIGFDREKNELAEGIEKQTHQVMKNLQAVLEAAGSDLEHVVKTTLFLKNINDFNTVNEIYGSYFSNNKPARTTIGVANLPKGAIVEIDMIATTK